jgi:5-methylcytosine-specific restriction endonuclease McrA
VNVVRRGSGRPRTCVRCGSAFTARSDRALYCSPRCKGGADPALAELLDSTCAYCGRPFQATRRVLIRGGGKARRYCSASCIEKAHQARRCHVCHPDLPVYMRPSGQQKFMYCEAHDVKTVKCRDCGRDFSFLRSKARDRRLCDLCRVRVCAECGASFVGTVRDVSRCPSCMAADPTSWWDRAICRRCGDVFTYERRQAKRTPTFCSDSCRFTDKVVRRQHRLRAAPGDDISLQQLIDRDGLTCAMEATGRCAYAGIDMLRRGRRRNDPLLVTIDHIVPIAPPWNGAHSWGNVQLAHFGCNARKGARSSG